MNDAQTLPHAIEAEHAVLGAVLYDNTAYGYCEALEPHHFAEEFHGRLWKAVGDLVAAGVLAAPELLIPKFADDAAFNELGGAGFLVDLIDRAPPARNAKDFTGPIIDAFLRRELIRISQSMAGEAQATEMGAKAQLERAEAELYSLAERNGDGEGVVTFASALKKSLASAAAAYARDGAMTGLSTGLSDLDYKLGGLHRSDLLILAGRPSMGKTALATNIAFHIARRFRAERAADGEEKAAEGGRVLFFSLEMSDEQLTSRILAEVTGISNDRVRKGEITAADYGVMRDAALEIEHAPLSIDATGGISLPKLAARARRVKRRSGLDLIVIDYLQLMTSGQKHGNRVEEVSAITTGLKALAKDLDVPVLALSQLSRQVEAREDKRPQLSDLRESGSIEQDADVVMFVYRESYYLGRAEPDPQSQQAKHFEWSEKMSAVQGMAEVIIGKQRHGPIGTVRLAFDENTTKFGNLARDPGAYRQPYGDA